MTFTNGAPRSRAVGDSLFPSDVTKFFDAIGVNRRSQRCRA
jgi:hypothetical protein